jgi:hypothetical protein
MFYSVLLMDKSATLLFESRLAFADVRQRGFVQIESDPKKWRRHALIAFERKPSA